MTGAPEGRSRVISDSNAARTWCEEIWTTTPEDPLGRDPGPDPRPVEPPRGGVAWRMVTLSPHRQIAGVLAAGQVAGVDADGFHLTDTVDYVFVLDHPVELLLDEGSVVVHPGDCVVQRATNHAWRNHGDAPVRLLTVMVRTS